MGENSKIEWTDHTFNPWIGCQRVSPGCERCYAETQDSRKRWEGRTHWGPTAPRYRTSESTWRNPLKWNREAEAAGKRARVFCASLADVFEDRAELVPWRNDLFALIEGTRHLDWLLLTKRPENISKLMPAWGWPPANVWLGTTVEDQPRADERLDCLLDVPAAVHFVSAEPLLESIDLRPWLKPRLARPRLNAPASLGTPHYNYATVSWVICGGESGHNVRPFDVEWARSLRDQCEDAGVAFFMKQYGARTKTAPDLSLFFKKGEASDPMTWPADLRRREFPTPRST